MLISLVDTTCLANMTDKTALTGDSAAIPFHSSSLTKGVLVSRKAVLTFSTPPRMLCLLTSFEVLEVLGMILLVGQEACFCWHKQDMSWPRRDQINWPLQHDTLQDHPFGEAALP